MAFRSVPRNLFPVDLCETCKGKDALSWILGHFFFTVSEDRFRTPPFFRLLGCEGKDSAQKGGIQTPRHANRHEEKGKVRLYWSSLCLSIIVLFPYPGDSFPQWQLYDVSCSLEIPIEYVKNKFFFFVAHPSVGCCHLLLCRCIPAIAHWSVCLSSVSTPIYYLPVNHLVDSLGSSLIVAYCLYLGHFYFT